MIAIIPARGGSKRIPRKNIRPFHGKPIIAYSIEVALKSKLFDRVIVSTDDDEIAEVARQFGAEVPFMRPRDLANDFATTQVVIEHAINWLLEAGQSVEYVCCIYATSPFMTVQQLCEAVSKKNPTDMVFPCAKFPSEIQRSFKIVEGKSIMFQPENFRTRTQDLEKAYFNAGTFILGSVSTWLNKDHIALNGTPIIIDSELVCDIDTEEDWIKAELKMTNLSLKKS